MEELSIRAKALYEEELASLNAFRASGGKTAALVCRTFPSAVLAGLGLRPVRLPFSLSGGQREETETLVRQDVCPLVLELLSSIQSDCADVIIGMHSCDTTRRFFQESDRFTSIPVHQIQLPATLGDASLGFFNSQVNRVCRDLILDGFSEGYDSKVAEEWYRNTMETAGYLRSLVKTIPPVALQYILHLFRIADPTTLRKKIEKLLAVPGKKFKPEFTLLLSGSPITPGDDSVAETVEEMGGALIPVNCTGFQMFPEKKEDDFSISSISTSYFNSMKCVRCRPNEKTFEHLIDELSNTGATGLIVKSLVFCDLWFTEKVRLKERIPAPVMVVDTGFSSGESERTAVRVEAFIQSLEINGEGCR